MKYVSGRLWLGCLCVGLLAMSGVAGAAEVSLIAVAINDSPITPTSSVTAGVGDLIECEIYASDWFPNGVDPDDRLRNYQFMIDGSQFGLDLPVMPAYWDDPHVTSICYGDGDCPPDQKCWISEGIRGFCTGLDHHPEDGAYFDNLRPDYIFAPAGSPPPEFAGVDLSNTNFRFASTLLQVIQAPFYFPPPKYVATYTLEVMPGACGTFTVGFLGAPYNHTFMMSVGYVITLPDTVGLEISTGDCACNIVGVDPPNCAIDARQPSNPDGTQPDGWNSMTFTVDEECDPCNDLDISDFEVRELPFNPMGDEPTIVDISCSYDPRTVTLTFDRIISEGMWTCARYLETFERYCMGYQPGDVNGDRTSAPSDILRVIDCLNNVATCEDYQCDVDRSNVCGPPDILRVIDLLNGAGTYPPYLNTQIPIACPTAP